MLMKAMKEKVSAKEKATSHHSNLPPRTLSLECCKEAWHREAVAKYVKETVRPALRVREERDAKVAPLVAAVRQGDYEIHRLTNGLLVIVLRCGVGLPCDHNAWVRSWRVTSPV